MVAFLKADIFLSFQQWEEQESRVCYTYQLQTSTSSATTLAAGFAALSEPIVLFPVW